MYRRVRALALVMVVAGARAEAATLQSAHAAIQILHDGTCEVRMRFVMASDAPVTSEHRLFVSDSAVVDDVIVRGARSFTSHGIDAVEVGVVVSALLFVIVSRMTPPAPAENIAIFFAAKDGATPNTAPLEAADRK